MKKLRRFLAVSAVLALGTSVASASSIFVDTFTFGPGGSYDYNLANPINGTVSFNANLEKFDDNLLGGTGTLQNIAFILTVTNLATASATNGQLTCGVGCTPGGDLYVTTIGGTVPVVVNGPSGMNTSSTPQATITYGGAGQVVHNIFTSCVGFSCTVDPSQILTVTGLSATLQSSTNVANTVLDFAPYHQAGSGSFISGLTIQVGPAGVVGVGDSNLQYSANSTISGSLQVIYTYDSPVPEPMTSVLMGTALTGLAVVIRRKRATR